MAEARLPGFLTMQDPSHKKLSSYGHGPWLGYNLNSPINSIGNENKAHLYMEVSQNEGTPTLQKSSMSIGISIINHPC